MVPAVPSWITSAYAPAPSGNAWRSNTPPSSTVAVARVLPLGSLMLTVVPATVSTTTSISCAVGSTTNSLTASSPASAVLMTRPAVSWTKWPDGVPTSRQSVPLPALESLSTCQPPALWMFRSVQSIVTGATAWTARVASNGGVASIVRIGMRIVPSSGSAGPAIENAAAPVRVEPAASPKALSGPRSVSVPLLSVPMPENPTSVLYTAPSVEVPFERESFAPSFPPKNRTVPSELYSIARWNTSSAVENGKTYWRRSAAGVDCVTAL